MAEKHLRIHYRISQSDPGRLYLYLPQETGFPLCFVDSHFILNRLKSEQGDFIIHIRLIRDGHDRMFVFNVAGLDSNPKPRPPSPPGEGVTETRILKIGTVSIENRQSNPSSWLTALGWGRQRADFDLLYESSPGNKEHEQNLLCSTCDNSLDPDTGECPTCLLSTTRPALAACPTCQADTPVEAEFCRKCGYDFVQRQAVSRYCPTCTSLVRLNAEFCKKCGARLPKPE